MTDSAHDPVIALAEEQCWGILAGHKVGRLVTVVNQTPEIFPVNFVLDGHALVFRTAEGSKLFSLTVNQRVAFEVDGWDATGGWSVVVHGTAEEITHADEVAHAEKLPLRPWIPTVKTHWVRVHVEEITGRQFVFGPEPEPEQT